MLRELFPKNIIKYTPMTVMLPENTFFAVNTGPAQYRKTLNEILITCPSWNENIALYEYVWLSAIKVWTMPVATK